MNTAANTPFELFFDQLRDLYSLKIQLLESMHHLVSLCTDEELQYLIGSHAHQNCDQIAEIVGIFERHAVEPGSHRCTALEGLIKGGTVHLAGVQSPHTRDLMMIAHCMRIEYYEMAAYEITTLLSGRLGLMREPMILSELLAVERDMVAALMRLEPKLFEAANSRSWGNSSTTLASRAMTAAGNIHRPTRRTEKYKALTAEPVPQGSGCFP